MTEPAYKKRKINADDIQTLTTGLIHTVRLQTFAYVSQTNFRTDNIFSTRQLLGEEFTSKSHLGSG